jgi:patatin-like phospholipase/acyl hydrolase
MTRETPASPDKYRIISLDGGGLRTLVSLGVLKRIEQERPGFLDEVQLVAGTSAGSISALILAAAPRPSEGLDAARDLWFAPGLFTIPFGNRLGALAGQTALTPNEAMAQALTGVLGDKTLGDLKRHVVIPAFQLDAPARRPWTVAPTRRDWMTAPTQRAWMDEQAQRSWRPRAFHNLQGKEEEDTFVQMGDFLVDLALRSSAAPIVSPVYQGYADGGLFANNPTLAAIAQVIWARAATMNNLLVLSLGTGNAMNHMKGYNENWGYAKWLLDHKQPMALLAASIEANVEAIDFQAQMLLPKGNALRVDPPMPFNLGNSVEQQVTNMDQYVKRFDLTSTLKWVDESGWMPPRRPRRAQPAHSEEVAEA